MKLKNIDLITEILNVEDRSVLKAEQELLDYDWDSLAMVYIQTHFSDTSGIEIDPQDLESLNTIQDLDNFITCNL